MNEELSILVIGLDSELYHVLELRLKPCGYSLRSACGARDALNCLKDHPFELAILNSQLPDAFGICLLSMIKRLYPRLPVLILSADDSTDMMVKALKLGAAGYLLIPVDLEQLIFCVNEIFGQRQAYLYARSKKRLGRVRPRRIYRGILNEIEEEI